MNKSFENLSNAFEDTRAKAISIESFLNNYTTLNQFEEFNNKMQSEFLEMIRMLQYDLINDIEKLQNDFISEYKDAICTN